MSRVEQTPEQVVGRILAKAADTITDGETGKRGVILRPAEDGGLTIMEDAETGGQAIVIWLTGPAQTDKL